MVTGLARRFLRDDPLTAESLVESMELLDIGGLGAK
jgi:hypothetical protein